MLFLAKLTYIIIIHIVIFSNTFLGTIMYEVLCAVFYVYALLPDVVLEHVRIRDFTIYAIVPDVSRTKL